MLLTMNVTAAFPIVSASHNRKCGSFIHAPEVPHIKQKVYAFIIALLSWNDPLFSPVH